MTILIVLIPLSLLLLGAAVGLFVWAVRKGQFDDLDTPAMEILAEERAPADPDATATTTATAHRTGRRGKADDAEASE